MYSVFLVIFITGFALCFIKYPSPKNLLIYAVLSIAWLPFYASIMHDDTSRHKTIFITISFTLILMFIVQAGSSKLMQNKYILTLTALFLIFCNTIHLVFKDELIRLYKRNKSE